MENYSRNMDELKCRSCGKWYIKKEYFRKVKNASGMPPNCMCQLGSGDIGGNWVEVPESDLDGYRAARSDAFCEIKGV